jgi:hypothetical protein
MDGEEVGCSTAQPSPTVGNGGGEDGWYGRGSGVVGGERGEMEFFSTIADKIGRPLFCSISPPCGLGAACEPKIGLR